MNRNYSTYATLACVCLLVAMGSSGLSLISGAWLVVSLASMVVFAVCIYSSIRNHEYRLPEECGTPLSGNLQGAVAR